MAKGTIIGHTGAGWYDVTVHWTVKWIDKRLADISTDMTDLTAQITDYTDVIVPVLTTKLAEQQVLMDAAIAAYNADPEANKAALQTVSFDFRNATEILKEANQTLIDFELEKAALEKENAKLTAERVITTVEHIPCADYADGDKAPLLSGEVNVAVWSNNPALGFTLLPSYNGGQSQSINTGSSGAKIQDSINHSAAGTVWNWTMMPAFQKWRSPYRVARITDIDLCTLTATINYQTTMPPEPDSVYQSSESGVEVDYMTYGIRAFSEGDLVLVRMAVGAKPAANRIIGFANGPSIPDGDSYTVIHTGGEPPTGATINANVHIVTEFIGDEYCVNCFSGWTGWNWDYEVSYISRGSSSGTMTTYDQRNTVTFDASEEVTGTYEHGDYCAGNNLFKILFVEGKEETTTASRGFTNAAFMATGKWTTTFSFGMEYYRNNFGQISNPIVYYAINKSSGWLATKVCTGGGKAISTFNILRQTFDAGYGSYFLAANDGVKIITYTGRGGDTTHPSGATCQNNVTTVISSFYICGISVSRTGLPNQYPNGEYATNCFGQVKPLQPVTVDDSYGYGTVLGDPLADSMSCGCTNSPWHGYSLVSFSLAGGCT